jgi:hypothetical protein
VLSDIQLEVARLVAGLPEAADFALAGGAALIVRGDVDRRTRDLDFFGLDAESVDRLVPAAEGALRSAGFEVERILQHSGFTRLMVTSGDDATELDLATDARLLPIEQGPGFPVLSGEELAADKVLAVFGRAEARDYVDLMAVERRFGLERLFELALAKDPGFSPAVFVDMLDSFPRLRRDEFPIDDGQFDELQWRVGVWRSGALEIGRTGERGVDRTQDLEHDRKRGHGLDP